MPQNTSASCCNSSNCRSASSIWISSLLTRFSTIFGRFSGFNKYFKSDWVFGKLNFLTSFLTEEAKVEQRWILFGQPFKVWKYCTGEKSLHNEPILRNKILTFFFSEIFVFFCFVLSGTTVLWDHRDLYVWDRFVLFILILRHVNVDICSSHVFDVKARLYKKKF